MDNKHFIPLNVSKNGLSAVPVDVLLAQVRIVAHRLDKQMQLSASRKLSFNIRLLEPLSVRLREYESRDEGRHCQPEYSWALNIERLYLSAIHDGDRFRYPWKEVPGMGFAGREFERLVLTRRSIRSFIDAPIDDAIVRKIVEYGSWAPSTCNVQAVRFIVAKSTGVRAEIVHGGLSGTAGGCVIATVVDLRFYDDYNVDGPIHDSAAAIENMLLGAHCHGLGGCYISDRGVDADKYRALLGVGDYEKITAFTWIGYYDRSPIVPARRSVDDLLKVV
ncbi:MAG TPA: nitroreductase family protein [Methanocella sp.]|nr:nitroreductase family protein [Methanocella sp.]